MLRRLALASSRFHENPRPRGSPFDYGRKKPRPTLRENGAFFVELGENSYAALDQRAAAVLERRGSTFRTFEMKAGRLVATYFVQAVSANPDSLLVEVTYTRYTGTFPPAGWPTRALTVE